MNGVAEGTFKPYGSLSRAMIVTILYRQEGSPYASGSGFRDVPSDAYYADAVAWAAEEEITGGITATAGGITAAIFLGLLVALLFKPKPKR